MSNNEIFRVLKQSNRCIVKAASLVKLWRKDIINTLIKHKLLLLFKIV